MTACGLLGPGCASTPSQYTRDGETYGVTKGVFHGRWWNYYERGASFVNGGFYAEAQTDFEQALRDRSRDSWSARTYGMHFVEYFPNRELGVTYYHLGRLDEAEKYLTTSLSHVDTARAHDYLDLVKKAKLAKGLLSDTAAPSVSASLTDGMVLATREVPVEISASDDLAVMCVRLNGRQLHQRGSAKEVSFQDALTLEEGTHAIQLEAGDLTDKQEQKAVNVTVDLTGPAVGIFEPPAYLVTDGASVRLRGATSDVNGIASVRLGDTVIAEGHGDKRIEFERELPLSNGRNTFVVTARDVAGNETFSTLSIVKGSQAGLATFLIGMPDRLLRPFDFMKVRFTRPAPYYPELAGRAHFAADGAATNPIQIDLKFPKAGAEYRKNEIRITGRVQAQTRVESLTINDVTFDLISAPTVEFSKRVPMRRGPNAVNIEAKDDRGNTATERFEIVGRPVALDTPESKMSLSVLAFGGAAEEATRQSLRAQTEGRLVQGNRFNVVDRVRLAEVLQEQQLSAALSDPDRALALGKVIPANAFLVGDVIARGNELEVYTRVVSTETSRILATLDAHVADKNDAAGVEYALDSIANALARTFPRVPGEIVKATGANLVTNIGKEEGIHEGMYLLVVEEEEPVIDESTGEVLIEGNYVPVGRARITQVLDKASKAEAIKDEGEPKLAAGMPAITM